MTVATGGTTMTAVVRAAITSVDDPEMPGVSIVDLGLLETLELRADGGVTVGLIPTFSGCPALRVIADDVAAAVSAVDGVSAVQVDFLRAPVWTIDRVSPRAEVALGRRLGVAVERDGVTRCPRCAAVTVQSSLFGPTRCRAVHVCTGCAEVVEVMR
jgi:ring-1,2-phenylacetyl-CoA epoxidase subunit PaaD